MSELLLLPRLHPLGVRRFRDDLVTTCTGTIDSRMKALAAYLSFASSGGAKATMAQLTMFRDGIVEIALRSGFPEKGSKATRAAFDTACGAWLIEHGTVSGGEALRDDVWAFVACCVAPDVSLWRFESAHSEHFRGGVRNTFQRLWLRAVALDRGSDSSDRWQLLQRLSEDALVQITERPAIGSDPQIAIAIGESWIATADRIGASKMEQVTRDAIRRIRIANETICFSALPSDILLRRFIAYFDEAAARA